MSSQYEYDASSIMLYEVNQLVVIDLLDFSIWWLFFVFDTICSIFDTVSTTQLLKSIFSQRMNDLIKAQFLVNLRHHMKHFDGRLFKWCLIWNRCMIFINVKYHLDWSSLSLKISPTANIVIVEQLKNQIAFERMCHAKQIDGHRAYLRLN